MIRYASSKSGPCECQPPVQFTQRGQGSDSLAQGRSATPIDIKVQPNIPKNDVPAWSGVGLILGLILTANAGKADKRFDLAGSYSIFRSVQMFSVKK